MNGKRVKITAVILSVCLLALWWMLGTGATFAWFSDTSPESSNQFYFGELKLEVSFKHPQTGTYLPLSDSMQVFDGYAPFEPGCTYVTRLKIENTGDVDLRCKLSVTVQDVVLAYSVLGTEIYLPNFLKFGAVFAESEQELDRLTARNTAGYSLGTWSEYSPVVIEPGQTQYVDLVLYMPEEVDNHANYRGSAPSVDLGISVLAQQADAPLE